MFAPTSAPASGSMPGSIARFDFKATVPHLSQNAPLFNFTGSKDPTPDPATIFGNHSRGSRESTPFGSSNGATVAGFGQVPPSQLQPSQQQLVGMFGLSLLQPQPAQPSFASGFGQAPTLQFSFNAGLQQTTNSGSLGFGANPNTVGNFGGFGGFGAGAAGVSSPTPSAGFPVKTPQVNPRRVIVPRSRRR